MYNPEMEVQAESEEYRLLVEFTVLVKDVYESGESEEERERIKSLKKSLADLGIIVTFQEVAPGDITYTINRLH